MEHVISSRNDECHFMNTKNNDMNSSTHDEDGLPLFVDFPSPFFDDITTIPMLENNYHTTPRQHHLSSSPSKQALNIADQSSSPTTELKQRTKKRSVGKKDRHSKINTAQGLRDRRMRLSLDIARKFFDLQDLLGFDKASKTIEWLFCKSNKAIKEVADNYFIINPQQQTTNNQRKSICDEIERMADSLLTSDHEIKLAGTTKLDSTKEEEEMKNRESYSRKVQINNNNNNLSVKETRDLARARARDRTRERLMIKEQLENKSKHLFSGGEYPNNHEIYRFGLRGLASPNNHNVEDQLGYTSSSSKPTQQSSLSFEQHSSSTHQYLFQDQLQSTTTNVVKGFNVGGVSSTYGSSTLINNDDRPAADWPNYYSNNTRFSGMAPTGDWEEEEDAGGTNYFMTDEHYYCNYGIVPSTPAGHLTAGDIIYEQNPSFSSSLLSNINNMHFQSSQNQR